MLIFVGVSAQFSKDSTSHFVWLGNGFDSEWASKSAKLDIEASIGSNSFNNAMFNDVLFRSGFVSKGKEKFLESKKQSTKLYAQLKTEVEYKVNPKLGVYLKYKSLAGYEGNTSFTKLVLFGNKNFQEQTIKSGELDFLFSNTVSAGATFKSNIGKNISGKLGVGLNTILDHQQIQASELSIYTANRGEYIQVDFNDFSASKKTSGLKGVGVDLNYSLDFKINNKSNLKLKLADVSVNYLLNQKSISLDTSFSFEGYEFMFGEESQTFSDFIDSSYTQFVDRGTKSKKWLSLPSRMELSFAYLISDKSEVSIELYALGLGKFGVGGSLALNQTISKNIKLISALGFGDFTGITYREAIEFRMPRRVNVYINLVGLQSIFVPLQTTNYCLGVGIAKHL